MVPFTALIIFVTWNTCNVRIFKAVLGRNSLVLFMVRVEVTVLYLGCGRKVSRNESDFQSTFSLDVFQGTSCASSLDPRFWVLILINTT